MRHFILTCKNHPDLRWSCKSIAYTPGRGYNGARSIFFNGKVDDQGEHIPGSDETLAPFNGQYRHECPCPPSDLILAPGETGVDEEITPQDPTVVWL